MLPFLLDVMTSLQFCRLDGVDSLQVGLEYNLVIIRAKIRKEKREREKKQDLENIAGSSS